MRVKEAMKFQFALLVQRTIPRVRVDRLNIPVLRPVVAAM